MSNHRKNAETGFATETTVARLLTLITLVLLITSPALAQERSGAQGRSTGEQQPAQKEREKKALLLLETVLAETVSLKTPENRTYVQSLAADLLWPHDEQRGRALFKQAATSFEEVVRHYGQPGSDQDSYTANMALFELRKELLESMGRCDPELALEFLRSSRPLTRSDGSAGMMEREDANEELSLAAKIAENDPARSLKIAEDTLAKGLSPQVLTVLSALQTRDPGSARRLGDEILDRLLSQDPLKKSENALLALQLLCVKLPLPQNDTDREPGDDRGSQCYSSLDPNRLRDLAIAVVAEALRQAPGLEDQSGGRLDRREMAWVETMLATLEQYSPPLLPVLRERISALERRQDPQSQAIRAIQLIAESGDEDKLLEAAAKAPPEVQVFAYRAAVEMAAGRGNFDRARQLTNEKISNPSERDRMLTQLDRRNLANAVQEVRIDDARALLSRDSRPDERAAILCQLAAGALKRGDVKTAALLLEEALQSIPGRARNYQQLTAQLDIAGVYAGISHGRSSEILNGALDQLNSLATSTEQLEGFEVHGVSSDGELFIRPDSGLGRMLNKFGEGLASLAAVDIDGALTIAARFDRAETRVSARLTIIRRILK